MPRSILLAPLGLAAVAAGCRAPERATLGPACGLTYGEAVAVTARDARTGAWLPAAGSRGVVTDGVRADSLRPEALTPVPRVLLGGGDRTGLFAVRVERAGYARWERTGVVVARNACGVVTVGLTADLEPAA
jgi:hypothetical protein